MPVRLLLPTMLPAVLPTVSALGLALVAAPAALGQADLVWETTVSITDQIEGPDDMAVDGAGNTIVIGDVEGDFFVLKLDPAGTPLWTRMIGGSGLENAGGVAVDGDGDIYLAGRTLSSDFPTVLAYQDELHGPSDAVLVKLDGDDGSTLFATYFGGARAEWAHGVAVAPDGSIVIVGQTDSIDLETADPIQDGLTLIDCFCDDAFVTRFSPAADAVVFSTYLGGTYDDVAGAVGVSPSGTITFTGRTKSEDFPTASAAQPFHGGGDFDAFVASIAADGTLVYSTFLGGEDRELVHGIAVDHEGAAYVAGSTQSITYPTTAGAFQEDFIGGVLACEVPFGQDHNCFDMFVTRLAPDGALSYSTFVGGTSVDESRNVAVDDSGRAFVIGYSASDDFPLGGPDANIFAFGLDPAGSTVETTITHWTPGISGGAAIAVRGDEITIASTVGLPYDTYIARYGSAAHPADIDGDGLVGTTDLLAVLGAWGPCPPAGTCSEDVNGDGAVDLSDLLEILASWGPVG